MPDDDAPLLGGGIDGGETGGETGGDRPRPRPPSPARRQGATPTATTLILLGDMFGLGALSLPSVFARLGWLPATALLLLFSAATIYSSRLFALLWRLAPRARVFDDYGSLVMGKLGRRLTYLGVYLCIFFEPPIFAVTVAESLRVLGLFAKSNASTAAATALIMIPLAQVQELEGIAAFSAVGVAGMAVAAAAAVACLLGLPTPLPPKIISDRRPTRLVRTSGVGAASLAAALFDVVFTYGGQVNWNRYTTGKRDPSQFPRCVAVAVALTSTAYAAVGGVGYFVLGEAFDYSKPLTSLLPAGVDVVVANVGLLAHTLLAFQINVNGAFPFFFFFFSSFFSSILSLSLSSLSLSLSLDDDDDDDDELIVETKTNLKQNKKRLISLKQCGPTSASTWPATRPYSTTTMKRTTTTRAPLPSRAAEAEAKAREQRKEERNKQTLIVTTTRATSSSTASAGPWPRPSACSTRCSSRPCCLSSPA